MLKNTIFNLFLLADFAVIIDQMKSTKKNLANSPVILFGGSYGGMLAENYTSF